jgi:hypothetical protein
MTNKNTLPEEITENGIHYTLHGDYYFPDLAAPETDSRPIGKWGRMHLAYLKEHKPGLYSHLILSGRLYRQLAELNDQAQARLEVIVRQMQRSEGVDEKMKAQDQMLWIGRMNSIRERAEEIILAELIFI